MDIGIAGIWNDMNEPSVFYSPTGTLPLDVVHEREGNPTDHREVHNVYGQLMTQATFEGLQALEPNVRPFILTRASFAGGQRFAAVWTGDATADWTSLRQSVSTLLGMGVSGFSLIGADIGGFSETASAELFTRWLQVGIFYPFMRTHAAYGTPDKEPWAYGDSYEAINRQAIELRYQLLPHIYNLMHEASITGIPPMRPMFLEFPEIEEFASVDNQFLFGPDLLIAPILWEGSTKRAVHLPPGDWFEYKSKRHYQGDDKIFIQASLDSIPMFVRSGGMIFSQPVIQHTGEMNGNPLKVLVFPAEYSEHNFYEDDGLTLEYQKKVFLKRKFSQKRNDQEISLTILPLEGHYSFPERSLILEIVVDQKPHSVTFQYQDDPFEEMAVLMYSDPDIFKQKDRGWTYLDGIITIKDQDGKRPVTFKLKNM